MDTIKERREYAPFVMDGKEYRIYWLDAYTAMYIGYQLMNAALPPLIGSLTAEIMPDRSAAAIAATPMSKSQFTSLLKDVLSCTKVRMDSGWINVINDNGSPAVPGMETNVVAMMTLAAESIKFNFKDFFAGKLLPLVGGVFGMSPPNTET